MRCFQNKQNRTEIGKKCILDWIAIADEALVHYHSGHIFRTLAPITKTLLMLIWISCPVTSRKYVLLSNSASCI